MDMHMSQFNLNVIDVVDKQDGTALVTIDIDEQTRNFIKNLYGWKRWSSKKFQQVLLQAIHNYIKEGPNDGSI
jgi:hypothetical protein